MAKLTVNSDKAPAPLGYYSQAQRMGPLIFISGQLPIRPEDGRLEEGGTKKQAYRALYNLYQVLTAAGRKLEQIVHLTLYVTDDKSEKYIDEELLKYFPKDPPARSTVYVTRLPKRAALQVDAIAVIAG